MSLFDQRDSCPVCDGGKVTAILELPYSSGDVCTFLFEYYRLEELFSRADWASRVGNTPYALDSCQNCQAIYQRFAPTSAFAAEIYAQWIGRPSVGTSQKLKYLNGQSGEHWQFQSFAEHTHKLSEAMRLTKLLINQTGKRYPRELKVLDYGLGTGVFARAMQACGCRVFGYDLADNRQQAARESGIQMLSYGDIAHEHFHFINTEQVFEHIPSPLQTGKYLASVLEPTGFLKVSVPFCRWVERGKHSINWHEKNRYSDYSPMPYQPLEHLTYFRRPSLLALGERIGLKEVRPRIIDELNYSVGWLHSRQALKNLASAYVRQKFKNYFLFSKPSVGVLPN
ncbi:class I SAM-dependent methyltransferase [Halieaceae bacterium IMCC14734]|uniref:Class I SAM-dependent methyltransferase n=1 Tax=Candidatus Litorirhabdus singularis TaxID=2518993 RepID=A0ABT3THB3_9GAMM|nr:class I SAM-dependent methyltransferase [Candidatus Litorirhabdus singularis]MCX2980777.1 class I SAM-dependent methyltransferase [Candidatus Litorirhabdus singularis]